MPFGGLGAMAALGVVSSLPKFYASFKQGQQASNLKLQDSRPQAFLEKEGLVRQQQAGQLPGYAQQLGRLGMVQNGALQSARLGAASSGDFLASASAADARRQQGEQQLGVQTQQYHDQANQRLGQVLDQDAAYHTKDLDTYNRTKAALTQSAAENLDNGIGTIAAYGAQGLNMGLSNGKIGGPLGAGGPGVSYMKPGANFNDLSTTPAGDYPSAGYGYPSPMGLRRARYNMGIR